MTCFAGRLSCSVICYSHNCAVEFLERYLRAAATESGRAAVFSLAKRTCLEHSTDGPSAIAGSLFADFLDEFTEAMPSGPRSGPQAPQG
jgi:hypothetical protein